LELQSGHGRRFIAEAGPGRGGLRIRVQSTLRRAGQRKAACRCRVVLWHRQPFVRAVNPALGLLVTIVGRLKGDWRIGIALGGLIERQFEEAGFFERASNLDARGPISLQYSLAGGFSVPFSYEPQDMRLAIGKGWGCTSWMGAATCSISAIQLWPMRGLLAGQWAE
jgi:hypothetical protein